MENHKQKGEKRKNGRAPFARDPVPKYFSPAEEAIKRVRRKNSDLVLPIIRHKRRAKVARFLLRAVARGGKRNFDVARTVQKARLFSRRRFFTEDDIARAVHTTSHILRKKRGERRHG